MTSFKEFEENELWKQWDNPNNKDDNEPHEIQSEYNIAEENILFNTEDLSLNLNKWGETPDTNVLFITGLCGSGKSTIANAISESDKNSKVISIDLIEQSIFLDNEEERKVVIDLIKRDKYYDYIPELKNIIKADITLRSDQEYIRDNVKKLIYKIIIKAKEKFKDDEKIIIEGYQLFDYIPPEIAYGKPLLIRGTSALASSYRAIKRATTINGFKNALGEIVKWLKFNILDHKNLKAYIKDQQNHAEDISVTETPVTEGIIGNPNDIILDIFSFGFMGNKHMNNILFKSVGVGRVSTKDSSYVNIKTPIKIETVDNYVEISNINFKRLMNMIKKVYPSNYNNLFIKIYNENDLIDFDRKLISKASVRIDKFKLHLFFALEMYNILINVYDRYKDNTTRSILKYLRENTWVKNINKSSDNIPKLSLEPTKKISLELNTYQKEFIENYPRLKSVLNLNGYILAFEQGLGKTLTAISLAECMNKDVIYIVCPNNLKYNWALEIKKYFKRYEENDRIFKNEVYIVDDKEFKFTDATKYIITNIESIPKMYKYIKPNRDSMLIIDECHNFRNIKGKRTNDLLELKEKINCSDVIACSGTPIKALPSEIIPMLGLIDPLFDEEAAEIYKKAFGSKSINSANIVNTRFGNIMYRKTKSELDLPVKYINPLPLRIDQPDKYYIKNVISEIDNLFDKYYSEYLKTNIVKREEFKRYVSMYTTSTREEYMRYCKLVIDNYNTSSQVGLLQMHDADREFIYNYLPVYVEINIPEDKKKEYKRVKTDFLYLKQSALTKAMMEVVVPLRNQLFIDLYDENKGTILGMIANNDKKTIIFSQFKPVIRHIYNDLMKDGIKCSIVLGDRDIDNQQELDKFHNDDLVDVLLATSQSLNSGVTLVEANQMFFFGTPWRSTDFDQCCDRIHRIGQTTDCYIYEVILESSGKSDVNLSTRMDNILQWSNNNFNNYINSDEVLAEAVKESYIQKVEKSSMNEILSLLD